MAPTQAEHVFHIALARDWEAARRVGEYRISTLGATLEEVGFIHGSFRRQVERIGTWLYGGVAEPLTVLQIDTLRLSSPVRVENVDGGSELFPHIYGPLAVEAVVATVPARTEDGRFVVEWAAAL